MRTFIPASLLTVASLAAGVANAQVGRAVSEDAIDDNFLTETLFMDDGFAGNAYDGNAMLGPAFGTSSWPAGDMWGITSRPLAADTQFDIPFTMADDSLFSFPGDTLGIVDESDLGRFFGIVDSVNGQDSDTGTGTWTFDISGAGPVGVTIDFAAMGDFESSNDTYSFTWSIDGSSPAPLFTIQVEESLSQSYTLAGGGVFNIDDPISVNGTPLDNVFATFSTALLGAGNTLTVEFVGGGDGGTEAFAFRNITLEAGPALTLNPDSDCIATVGDTLTVTIDATFLNTDIVGGQFFLSYDNAVLDFVSADAGDPLFTELFESVNEVAGTIDYAVNAPFGDPGTSADVTMVEIAFTTLVEICDASDLVTFRPHAPPTRLSDFGGGEVVPLLVDLSAITVDETDPEITCPADITVNADAGVCTASINPGFASATDNCDPAPMITWVRSDGAGSLTDPYDSADSPITITWTATDACGNTDQCVQTITVNAFNDLAVTVQLSPNIDTDNALPDTLTRCITFELWDCAGPSSVTVSAEVDFTVTAGIPNTAIGTATIDVPCGFYDCITARDRRHTLRRTDEAFGIVGTQYVADFTGDAGAGGDWLIGGNLNDDFYIDILDFGVFSAQFGSSFGTGDTTCATPAPHSDVSGDGDVDSFDFSFVQVNFLLGHEPNCCGQPLLRGTGEGAGGPITEISVQELRRIGLGHLAAGDLNRDGVLNEADMQAFANGARPQNNRRPVEAEVPLRE